MERKLSRQDKLKELIEGIKKISKSKNPLTYLLYQQAIGIFCGFLNEKSEYGKCVWSDSEIKEFEMLVIQAYLESCKSS